MTEAKSSTNANKPKTCGLFKKLVSLDEDGSIYIGDTKNHVLRMVEKRSTPFYGKPSSLNRNVTQDEANTKYPAYFSFVQSGLHFLRVSG